MTITWNIDCNKWKRITGIALWIGATIALVFGLYCLVSYSYQPGAFRDCNQYTIYDNNVTKCNSYGDISWPFIGIFYALVLASNIGNFVTIWYILNKKYKWLQIKCVSKH